MDPIIKDFEGDLDKVSAQLDFIEVIRKFTAYLPSEDDPLLTEPFGIEAKMVHEGAKRIHGNLPLASGTLILYACGRFESMTRVLFEDLCQRLVAKAGRFARLPKKMRENLPLFTAKVISEPRKYGHAENGVRTFVTTLASNLAVNAAVERINHECLSVTESNMRADVLADLFGRIGASNIWAQVSAQVALKAFFQEADSAKVEANAKRKLNDLMDLRNRIAHPSGEFDWPSVESLREYISFLRVLSRSMAELATVYEVTLCIPEANEPKVEAVEK
ncbi:hypothetical protein HH213_00680 [Duganella dendranthematis]|uniref:RiboL-PSP-HEPN domain-containing protein n=1 Tax=Duganella dendranthematis TaxID=2728021 RepID=A0ABX6M472_9BURK|nr:HEPN domain-containing protein [Duganella dendranthematis]QJD88756.1 hypothetical protein HH213_00680 [Duganella dendranthematis]